MSALPTLTPVLVGPADPEYMSHHEFEVKNPRRKLMAEHRERARVSDGLPPSREAQCGGTMRFADRALSVWTVQCDACGQRFGIPRQRVDRELLVAGRLRQAGIPNDLAHRDYEKTTGNEAARSVCRILVERWDTDLEPHPPLLYGATGRGKSHLLAKTALALVRLKLAHVRYWTVPDLLAAARQRIGDNASESFIARQASVELLVLDDMGAEQQTDWSREVLHRIVDHREREGLRLMGATNVDQGVWADVFGDRVASRLAACTTAVELTGDDWRERDTKPNRGAGNVVPLHGRRDAPPPNDTTHPDGPS